MKFSLKEIIDLDYFLGLDEGAEEPSDIGARDREIYREIESSNRDTTLDLEDDTTLILAWLGRRRQGVSTEKGRAGLPGGIYHSLYRWVLRTMAVLGLVAGIITAYSFLAYHGSRPVNVTLFISFFILVQALLGLAAGVVLVRRIQGGYRPYPLVHSLVFEVLAGKFKRLVDMDESKALSRFRSARYKGLLFWPLFTVTSVGALCFSLGCLGGTLFRVMVTDLAFGWQSTLFTSGAQVHHMVSALALPWSWILPDGAALPSLAQVEGSRIILKQGIAGLATEDLAAWWPFLCVGILVYAVIPRLAILAATVRANKKALEAFDMNRPRYRRLLMRMRSPRMDLRIRETGGSTAPYRPPLPDPARHPVKVSQAPAAPPAQPEIQDSPVPAPPEGREPEEKQERQGADVSGSLEITESDEVPPEFPEHQESHEDQEASAYQEPAYQETEAPRETLSPAEIPVRGKNTPALVLASVRSYPDTAMDGVGGALDRQLGIDMATVVRVGFDFEADQPVLAGVRPPEKGVVVVLYEVWQPPIRGLLYYFNQLKQQFPDHDLWIFLTRTPGEGEMGVAADEMDFKVWQTAVAQLKDPGIIVERWIS